jgi:uncharacterized protein GlcG (DUF336 family)
MPIRVSPTALTLEMAERAIAAGRARAAEIGVSMSITVVNASADLVASIRVDGAPLEALDTSAAKARAAGSPQLSAAMCAGARERTGVP